MITMHFLLLFSILVVILQSSVGVEPGDAFPTFSPKSKILTSEDLINANEIVDSAIDQTSSPLESLTDPIDPTSHEENSVDDVTTTSVKLTSINKGYKKVDQGEKYPGEQSSSSPIESTSTPKLDDDDIDKNVDLLEKQPSTQESIHLSSTQESSTLPSTQKSTTSSSTEAISKKNLIKIGRWRYDDPQTNKIRYWYEPEGGQMGTGWVFDGFIFQAYSKPEYNTRPVYAFHSELRSVWTNTIQMDPQPPVIGNDQWISDGVSFYTYKTSMNSTKLQPVVRYWNTLKKGAKDSHEIHITYLTMKEKNNDDKNRSRWTFDNILFYALPIED